MLNQRSQTPKRAPYSGRKQISGYQGQGWETDWDRTQENFGGSGNVLYLDYGDGDMCI